MEAFCGNRSVKDNFWVSYLLCENHCTTRAVPSCRAYRTLCIVFFSELSIDSQYLKSRSDQLLSRECVELRTTGIPAALLIVLCTVSGKQTDRQQVASDQQTKHDKSGPLISFFHFL